MQRLRDAATGARTAVLMASLLGGVLLLTGCGQYVSARVVPGPAGVATVVPMHDPRVSEETPGVAGAKVTVRAAGNAVLATGVTNNDGIVRLNLPSSYAGRIRIGAEADGYQRASSEVRVPPKGGWVLIVVRER